MSAPGLFRFDDLSGGYGQMTIVRGLSAVVDQASCLCVLGRNGVGKSTLLKILSGHLGCMEGRILLGDRPIMDLSADRRCKLGLSFAMQERPVFDTLTVRDNLMLMRPTAPLDRYQRYFDAFPFLPDRLSQVAGTLSGGERKILSFARTMAEDGRIILLDEPTEGVQPENIDRMKHILLQKKKDGAALIVVEQHLHLAEQIADDYLLMDQGRSMLQGAAEGIDREAILSHLAV